MEEPITATPSNEVPLRVGKASLFVLVLGLLLTVMSYPEFDPNTVEGGSFGTTLVVVWGVGLVIWALGLAKPLGRNLRVRTVLFTVGVLAVTFGAVPWIPMPHSVQVGFAVVSGLMVYEVLRTRSNDGVPPMAWRGGTSRFILLIGGIVGLALIFHNTAKLFPN